MSSRALQLDLININEINRDIHIVIALFQLKKIIWSICLLTYRNTHWNHSFPILSKRLFLYSYRSFIEKRYVHVLVAIILLFTLRITFSDIIDRNIYFCLRSQVT